MTQAATLGTAMMPDALFLVGQQGHLGVDVCEQEKLVHEHTRLKRASNLVTSGGN